ncbi:MAG: hypothetical protein LBG15_16295 [Dysgonamonadaceae bacterium]|nr:hypothetical protein [Dysgonamonadaceae bacterium]
MSAACSGIEKDASSVICACIMTLYYNLPIYKVCYDLLMDLYFVTCNFKREYKDYILAGFVRGES